MGKWVEKCNKNFWKNLGILWDGVVPETRPLF